MLRFRATQANQIQEQGCDVESWVIPVGSTDCTVRYAFYCLVREGFHRIIGQEAAGFQAGGWTRHHIWFSGKPYWMYPGRNEAFPRPLGHSKVWDGQNYHWIWIRDDSRALLLTEATQASF